MVNEAAQTLEGWYALHDFRTIDWKSWKLLDDAERSDIINEFLSLLGSWKQAQADKVGASVVYSIVGQKADFVFMHLREDLQMLNELENAFNKSGLGDYTIPSYSFVSVVELSNYLAKESEGDPMENPYVISRLKPELPEWEHICFYPMDKRRHGEDNWYMLDMEQRRAHMRSHGLIGRQYAGKIKQIITGSVGLDDWEWGVTLFSEDALQFKKIVYEMRFDEASARYGEFGEFFVGNRLDDTKITQLLSL